MRRLSPRVDWWRQRRDDRGSVATGNVTSASNFVGGLVGVNLGDPFQGEFGGITGSRATGNVTAVRAASWAASSADIFGVIDHSFRPGASGGTGSTVGGFGGLNIGTSMSRLRTVRPPRQQQFRGRFVGVNYSVGNAIPGLASGAISQAYAVVLPPAEPTATSRVSLAINVGSLDQTLATGLVTGGAGSTTGGLVASNTFTYMLPASIFQFPDPPGPPPTPTGTPEHRPEQQRGGTDAPARSSPPACPPASTRRMDHQPRARPIPT